MGYKNYPGNEELKLLFKKLIKNGALPQSLILQGGKLSFKEKTGFEIAKALHCAKGEGEACGECKHCKLMAGIKTDEGGEIHPSHPDFMLVEPEKELIKIDTVRSIMDFIISKPMISGRKVVLIKDIDRMNTQAFNAFLKILEEPYDYVSYIITTERLNLLADTIKSRCQIFYLKNVKKSEIYDFYNEIPPKTIDYAIDMGKSPDEVSDEEVELFENLNKILYELCKNKSSDDLLKLKKFYDNTDKNKKKDFIRVIIVVIKNILMDKIKDLKIEEQEMLTNKMFKIEEIEQDLFKNMNIDLVFTKLILNIIS